MATKTRQHDPRFPGFGAFVRRLRRARGLTQEKLSERSDLAPDTIRRLEQGVFSPSLDTMAKLGTGLRLDLSSLFGAFELGTVPRERQLLAMARSLSPEELALALRLLTILADFLGAVAAASERGEDA